MCQINYQYYRVRRMSNDAFQEQAANLNENNSGNTLKTIKAKENITKLGIFGVFGIVLLFIIFYRNSEIELNPSEIKSWKDKIETYHKMGEAKAENQKYQTEDIEIMSASLNKVKTAIQQRNTLTSKEKETVQALEKQIIQKQKEILSIISNGKHNNNQKIDDAAMLNNKKQALNDKPQQNKVKNQNPKDKSYIFPRSVWRYSSQSPNKLFSLIQKNVESYSTGSGFKFNAIKPQSQLSHLSKEAQQIILKRTSQPHLKEFPSISSVLKYFLIKLYTLKEKGGVWIDPNAFLYEGLEWIDHLDQNPYVINKYSTPPQVFSFYETPNVFGLPKDQLSQYFIAPKIDNSFIVAASHSKLITDWLNQYLELEANMSEQCKSKGKVPNENEYGQLYWNAVASVIKSKQTGSLHGVHYYGLRMMLDRYHAYKLKQVTNLIQHRLLDFMTQVPVEYAVEMSGPLKYIEQLQYEFIDLIKRQTNNLSDFSKIVLDNHSILSTYLLQTASTSTSQQDILEQQLIQAQKFNFPHVVWVYWATGYTDMDMIHALCLLNIKHYVRESGYELRLLDDSNVNKYISQESQQKIKFALRQAKLKTSLATTSDLVRLAILYEHGGIYLDQTIMLCQSLNWLQNIHKSKYVVGRTSARAPEVFFWFNTQHEMHQFSNDTQLKNKLIVSPGFESYFIAAIPKSQFIRECRQKHIQLLTHNEQYYLSIIERQGYAIKGSLKDLPYFIIMTGFQFVMQGKQKELDAINQKAKVKPKPNSKVNSLTTTTAKSFKYAMHYYGMISMDVKCGPYRVELNAFTYDYGILVELLAFKKKEYTQGIFGKFEHFIKLHHDSIGPVGSKVKEIVDKRLVATKGSFIQKHLLLLDGSEDIIGYEWK